MDEIGQPLLIRILQVALHDLAVKVEGVEEVTDTMEIAFDQSLSFYDSAYLQPAKKHGLTLATEDKRLSKRTIDAGVKYINIDDLKS